MKNHNFETKRLNRKPEIMQTNTLSAFNPRQKTKCAYLINLMTTDAMTKFPKAKPNQHLNTKSTNKNAPTRLMYNQDETLKLLLHPRMHIR